MKFAAVRTPLAGTLSINSCSINNCSIMALSVLISTSVLATGNQYTDQTISDSSQLSLKLRNYYQDRRQIDASNSYIERDTGKTVKTHDKQKAWGQGLEINFESAWLGSQRAGVGLDFSLYGGLKLIGENDRYGTTILKEDSPRFDGAKGKYLADQDSYGKAGQLFAKGFLGESGQKLEAKAGWHQIERSLMKTYHRLTPTTFQGVSVDAELNDFDLYGSWYNKVSRYNHDHFESLTSKKPGKEGRLNNNHEIDYAYTLGGSYNHESGLGTELAYAESQDYLKLYHANLNYTFQLAEETSLMLEGQYYKGKNNGSNWQDSKGTYGGFDDDASLYNLNARLIVDMMTFQASYSQVDAEKQQKLGVFDYHLAYDAGSDYDDLGYATKRQISDFNHNGEKVWQAGASYAFDRLGAPGLSLGYTYTKGSDIEPTNMTSFNNKYNESEHNVQLGYNFPQEQLKGLSFKLQFAHYKADKELSQIKYADRMGYEDEGRTDLRVYVDYTVSVF